MKPITLMIIVVGCLFLLGSHSATSQKDETSGLFEGLETALKVNVAHGVNDEVPLLKSLLDWLNEDNGSVPRYVAQINGMLAAEFPEADHVDACPLALAVMLKYPLGIVPNEAFFERGEIDAGALQHIRWSPNPPRESLVTYCSQTGSKRLQIFAMRMTDATVTKVVVSLQLQMYLRIVRQEGRDMQLGVIQVTYRHDGQQWNLVQSELAATP